MAELTNFITDCVKNIEPRFLEKRDLHHEKRDYDYYREITFTLIAKEDEYTKSGFSIYGYDVEDGEDFTEGNDINEAIKVTREPIDEIVDEAVSEYGNYSKLEKNSLEIAWDALELNESPWENGVIGKMTIKIALREYECDYYRMDVKIKPIGEDDMDLPF